MHIAIDCRWIRSQEIDGIGRYTLNIVRALLPLAEGNNVTLIFSDPKLEKWVGKVLGIEQFDFVSTYRLNYSVMTPSDVLYGGRDIADIEPDVLFEPNYITGAFHASYETIVVVHDLTPLIYYDEVCTSWRWKLLYGIPLFLQTIFRWSAAIITVSEHTRDDLHQHFPVSAEKTSVIHESCDPKFFQEFSEGEISEVKGTYDIPDQYVLCVSRHESYKNLDGLAEAYRHLPNALAQDYPLVLTGSFHEDWSPRLKRSMKDLIEQEKVMFTGFVADEHLGAVYQGATLFCLPSKYEGFGLPVLEAMASGCAVAASRRASIPEVAGEAAAYFDPEQPREIAETLQSLLIDPSRREKLVEEGHQQVQKFSWDSAAQGVFQECSRYSNARHATPRT